MALEVEDVAGLGAAPAVDRLVVVADHAEVAPPAGQPPHQGKLRGVGVLVLIDHDVAEALLVFLLDLGEVIEKPDHQHDQVVEVDGVVALQALLVFGVDARRHLADDVALHEGSEVRRAKQSILGIGDLPDDGVRLQAVVRSDVMHQVPDQALLVGGAVNAEVALVAKEFDIGAQDAAAERAGG